MAEFYEKTSRYRTTARYFNVEVAELTPYTEDKLYGSAWRAMKIAADYLGLPSKTRKALENINALNRPFNLAKTLKNLSVK